MNASPFTHLFTEELYRPDHRVVVVLSKKWDEYSADDKILLSKILGSVKLHIDAVRILSCSEFSTDSMASYSPGRVLIFGSETEGLKSYEPVQVNGYSVLKADDLSKLNDPVKKSSLWQALKGMFDL